MFKSCFILLSFVTFSITAQNSGFKIVYVNPATGVPSILHFDQNSVNRPNAESPDIWMRQNLNANSGFRLKYERSGKGADSYTHLRYQQYFGRFKVEAAQVILHLKNNQCISLNGKYFPQLDIDTSVEISRDEAIRKALALYSEAVFMWEIPSEEALLRKVSSGRKNSYYPRPELMIISVNDSCRNSDFRMAYKMDIYSYAPHSRKWIYIDARTGELLDSEEQLCNTDVTGLAHTRYSGIRNITCDSISADTFILSESGRGSGIQTIDVRIIGTDSSRDFIDHDNVWNNVNAWKDEVATDAHWGAEMTYDYFKQIHQRSSYDDSDGFILSKVHVGTNYVNAFWSGDMIHYGDGDNVKYTALTSIEICGHELSHGITQYSAGLRYRNESGALNESFSDIFGKCVEYYANPKDFEWLIAGKISLQNKPFRDMSFPPNQKHPKYYAGNFYYNGTLDNGGVHINSGVQNYWFYLLCTGGSGYREGDSIPYTVDSIGMEKASKIAYYNLNNFLVRESEYIEAAYLSLDAAAQIYGENSNEYNQVKKAWFAVGVFGPFDLGINSTAHNKSWSIYPNPGNTVLTIQNPLVYDITTLEIVDLTGKVLMNLNVLPGESIDVSSLSNGIYMIRIDSHTILKWVKN